MGPNITITNNIRNGRHTRRSDDDLNFEVVVAEKDRKKPYEVDFKVHSIEGIVKNQDEVTHVANILGILKEHAATLLRHFRWNKERLIERYIWTIHKMYCGKRA